MKLPRRMSVRGAAAAPATLAARHPDWFALGVVEIPPGWTALADQLFADLAAGLDAADTERLQVAAIKERDGRLAVDLYARVAGATKPIAAAVKASTRICQSCGAPGRRKSFAGWAATLCTPCRDRHGTMRIGANG